MNDNEISLWQEAISSLPDKQFFNTMRLYLGEIKTPYNKQRLTQQLASFIKKEENLTSLLTLLDSFDITILTAISLIPNASQETQHPTGNPIPFDVLHPLVKISTTRNQLYYVYYYFLYVHRPLIQTNFVHPTHHILQI